MYRSAILTVSTGVASGAREDKSGEILKTLVAAVPTEVIVTKVLPDDYDQIRDWVSETADGGVDLIVTTGGTGLSQQDVTPEAIMSVIDREVPGLAEAMRVKWFEHNPRALISRTVAGVRGKTLIIALPGSPRGMAESFEVIKSVLVPAMDVIREPERANIDHL
jgi:molybdenum cofactor synthesis domain-containing protein